MRKNRFRTPPRPARPFRPFRYARILLVLFLFVGLYYYLRDLSAPEMALKPDQGRLAPSRPISLALRDSGCGLASLRILARQNGKEILLLEKSYSGAAVQDETVLLDKSELGDGLVEVVVEARDRALFPFGNGNRARKILQYALDRQPPQIDLLSGLTPLWQGGAATIAYKVSEETESSGVEAGGVVFTGYRQPSGVYLCVVALPVDASMSSFKPKLFAVDKAGNEVRVSPGLQLLPRKFPIAKIPVSDAFLGSKTEEFREYVPDAEGVELFLRMNRDVRLANRKTLTELAASSAPTPLWNEPMLRMARAKATGDYAEARDYFYNNRLIDHQVHLGADLASVAQAPIVAANPGKVVFAGQLGIYGGCVVIDHGLGVQTLYGHLSAVETQVGAEVTRGQQIGRSGKSGMAAGDHLHFEVLVGGVPVRPEEWMERSWMQTNILGPMQVR